jgi:hypothetical protein
MPQELILISASQRNLILWPYNIPIIKVYEFHEMLRNLKPFHAIAVLCTEVSFGKYRCPKV